jgi:hypothetical protein
VIRRPTSPFRALLPTAALVLIAALAWPAGQARAATDSVTVVNPGPQTSSGDLTVTLDSSSALSAVTAHLTDGSGTDVLDPALSETSSTTLASGVIQSVWNVATPIAEGAPPDGIPLGPYAISLDISFGDGGSASAIAAGTLYFSATPQVTISADHTDVSYADKQVTISGQATQVNPGGAVTPYQGPVYLEESWSLGQVEVKANADGDFSAVVIPGLVYGPDPSVSAQVYYGSPGEHADSNAVTFDVQVDNARVTASLSSPTVRYGAAETVSGTVSYQAAPGGSYSPAAGEPFQVYVYSNEVTINGTTNAHGGYSVRLPDTAGAKWTVQAGGDGLDLLLNGATATVGESVQIPTVITNFHTSLNQYWKLSFSGCLGLDETIPDAYGMPTTNMRLQYALSPRGPWHTINGGYSFGSACGKDGGWFSGSTTAPFNYAYYRMYYPGFPGAATPTQPKYLSSTSASSLAWKYDDRITGFSVSPHVVASNGKLTVKGQLQYYYGKWHDYADQTIYIIFRPEGGSTWYWIVKAKTNSSGHFSAAFKDTVGSATWSAEFDGNATHLATGPAGVYVRVTG